MNRISKRPWQNFLIAFSVVWMFVCAFGSGFVHESLGCSHDLPAETVDHHEDDSAHWAAIKSDIFANSDCPVCITTSAFGIGVPAFVPLDKPATAGISLASPEFPFCEIVQTGLIPRAPPRS